MIVCFKQETAYERRISDWSSDVCSSDCGGVGGGFLAGRERGTLRVQHDAGDEEEGNCWDHDWNQGAHPGSPARKGREEKPARTAEGARRHARGTTTTRNGAGEHRDAPNVAYGPPTLRLACTVTPCWINDDAPLFCATIMIRSEEHTSELQSLMRISYAVFCLKKKNIHIMLLHHV